MVGSARFVFVLVLAHVWAAGTCPRRAMRQSQCDLFLISSHFPLAHVPLISFFPSLPSLPSIDLYQDELLFRGAADAPGVFLRLDPSTMQPKGVLAQLSDSDSQVRCAVAGFSTAYLSRI